LFFTASGNLVGSLSRGSKKRPMPCISRFAAKAFQYVTDPQPVRDHRRCGDIGARNHAVRHLLRIESLPIEEEFRIELAGAPGRKHLL
jgi:hypothetical protein